MGSEGRCDDAPSPEGGDWVCFLEQGGASEAAQAVREAIAAVGGAPRLTTLRVQFARLGRLVPQRALAPSECSGGLEGVASPAFFTADHVARVALVLGAAEVLSDADVPTAVTTLYRTGGEREQQSVLRALPWLPSPERFVELASEACRTNDVSVFSALCSDNPFPARHMPDGALFQMVMKAMFLGVSHERTWGLAERVTPELLRMVEDYENERRAAGRSVPDDISRIRRMASPAAATTTTTTPLSEEPSR